MKIQSITGSLVSFGLAVLAFFSGYLSMHIFIPEGAGSDSLDEAFFVIIAHTSASAFLAAVSAVLAIRVIKQHKIVWLWLIPSCIWVLAVVGMWISICIGNI